MELGALRDEDGNPIKGRVCVGDEAELAVVVEVPVRERVVEVEADLGQGSSPRYRYGSGLLMGERQVLTAAHVVSGATAVADRGPDKVQLAASLDTALVGDFDQFDLALLEVPDAEALPYVEVAVVDRDVTAGEVS